MLAAISTTILSRRSCALTCSAMTSRSRRNSTRGPPSAPRMAKVPRAWLDRSVARGAPVLIKDEFAQVPARDEYSPAYIECGMQTASQRQGYDAAAYCALQRKPDRLCCFIQAIERMQRPHCQFGECGIDQERKLDLRGGNG